MSILRAIQAVRAVQKRLDVEPLFTPQTEWTFQAVPDDTTCPVCMSKDLNIYYGDELQQKFPYLVVESNWVIRPMVHPNCRCMLMRKV